MRARPAWIALAWLGASCAPLPPPGAAPPPPAPREQPPRPVRPPGPLGAPAIDREATVDVGVAVDLDSLSLVPGERSPVSVRGDDETALGATEAPLRARVVRGGWEVAWQRHGGAALVTGLGSADTLWIGRAPGGEGGAGTRWAAKTWRGRIKVFVGPRGKLTLATRVPLETYLLGVVPAEIGGLPEELIEAGRAQAIAARSYTLFYRGRRAAEGFDVYGTVEDQVYAPIEGERTVATRCVETTRGEVALSADGPIRANYSSTCGGITADVWEAWPAGPLPYLEGRRDGDGAEDFCARSPQYRWREEWTGDDFLSILQTFGPPEGVRLPAPDLGELKDVRVASRSRSGRVWRLVVETAKGDVVVPAHPLRRVIRRPQDRRLILRSNLFKIDVRRDPATRRALAVVASGAGSGHGVGLCQTGALGMARAGYTGEQILSHYYSGIRLRRLY